MTIPNLPAQGDTDWYDWATGLDTEARKVAAKLDTSAASATYVTVVEHGVDATVARPAGAETVLWKGTVEPTNAIVDDLLLDTSTVPATLKRRNATVFEVTSNVVNGTVAGQIPAWDPVAGRYEPQTPTVVVAADVPFTPVGTIAATNVQDAIAEVAAEATGGSGSGAILGYSRLVAGSYTLVNSTVSAGGGEDLSTLAVTFTVPSSGSVKVKVSARQKSTSGSAFLTLREGTTAVTPDFQTANTNVYARHEATFYVTGLTPGASKTYKAGHRSAAGQTSNIEIAETATDSLPAFMEVVAL